MEKIADITFWMPIIIQLLVLTTTVLVGFRQLKKQLDNFKKQKIYEHQLDRVSKQISEFYGPIYMLTVSNNKIFTETFASKIWGRTWKNIIVPSEKEILKILKTKIHLLDLTHFEIMEIPQSFKDFFAHTSITHSLVETEEPDNITFHEIVGQFGDKYKLYPKSFDNDIARSYRLKIEEYNRILKSEELQATTNAKNEYAN